MPTADPRLVAAAAANNAAWCETVCRTHGIAGDWRRDAWTSARRTPPLHPDAVTLVPEPVLADLFDRIDASPGCSVKDSFASLDLSPHRFRVLFEAQWIVRTPRESPAAPVTGEAWTTIDEPGDFVMWERAWLASGGEAAVLRPELLDEPGVRVVARREGPRIEAGAILSDGGGVVGISNLFVTEGSAENAWAGCVTAAIARHPASTLVGYEVHEDLLPPLALGFEVAGPLRVWIRDS